MKLQDPRLERLLEAYRGDRRPTEAMRQRMWQRFADSRRPRRTWARPLLTVVLAVAAVALLWLAARGLTGQVAAVGEAGPGMQAPFGHEPSAGGRPVAAPGRGQAVPHQPAPLRPAGAATGPTSSTATPPEDEPGAPPPPVTRSAPGPRLRPSTGATPTATPTQPSSASSADPSHSELALIEAAEAALRATEPERALTLLRRHEERFAHAPTAQERQALRVLALCAAGREVEGRGARWAFLREHPRSAYRERIERACPSR